MLRKAHSVSLKYRLRLHAVPILARIGRVLGISWEKLGRVLGREVLIAQLVQLNRGVIPKSREDKLETVFLSMIGGHSHNMSVEAVLAMRLKADGHRSKFVICDQALPVCEVKKAGQESKWSQSCGKCYAFGKKYVEAFDAEVLPVSELSTGVSGPGEDWSELVQAALLKHYMIGVIEESKSTIERRELFENSAAITERVGQNLATMKPDRVVMSHGIYTTWGPQRKILNKAGIPVVTYGKGKKRSTQKFNWGSSSDWWDVSSEWRKVKNTPLTDDEEIALDRYLESRRSHSEDTLVYNFGLEESRECIRKRLELSPGKQTFVLFTNVLWDAASAQREIVFQDPIDWVYQTISWFQTHSDKQLVIKVHPAEVVIGTKQSFQSIIAKKFHTLPDNVRIISPDEQVNSWSILKITDIGLVHTSTVGLELALEGVPTIVVSKTHYRGRGFTVDVSSKSEYFERLLSSDLSDWKRDEVAALARRYFFLLFERYQLPWDFLFEVSHTDTRCFSFDTVAELIESPTLQVWMESFESHKDFLLPVSNNVKVSIGSSK